MISEICSEIQKIGQNSQWRHKGTINISSTDTGRTMHTEWKNIRSQKYYTHSLQSNNKRHEDLIAAVENDRDYWNPHVSRAISWNLCNPWKKTHHQNIHSVWSIQTSCLSNLSKHLIHELYGSHLLQCYSTRILNT
jgi:hypothetical protein